MQEPMITVSGLRGVVGQSLTPEVAIRYVTAFAAIAPPGPIVVARDSRPSGRMLSDAIQAGLSAVGRDTLDAGIAATPTAGVLVRHHSAAGGVEITASHNPSPYNGLKLFSTDGRVIPAVLGEKVLRQYRQGSAAWVPHDRLGRRYDCDDPHGPHLAAVLDTVDVPRIRQRAFRVLLDSNHGAGSLLGQRLLEALGCQVTLLGPECDGQFAHTPEPTAENLAGVRDAVLAATVDVGFCQDPDADRLAVIDAAGRYVGEEYTLALCLDHVLPQRHGPIVTNCATSRMSQDLAQRYGVPYVRTPVGEPNVVDGMLARGAVFGGEGNGGPIDPRVVLVRDSFVGMALLLDLLAARGVTMAQAVDALPRYAIHKTKAAFPLERLPAAMDTLEKRFAEARADRQDGLRLDWPDRWLLLRGSNTEPIVRAIAEAPTAAEAQELCAAALAVLETLRG
jgi:phosphomannomutase